MSHLYITLTQFYNFLLISKKDLTQEINYNDGEVCISYYPNINLKAKKKVKTFMHSGRQFEI